MSGLGEPDPAGLVTGGHLRASDADRDRVAAVLSTAYAEGRLTRDEHDERVAELLQAKTFDQLVPLTHDLVAAAPPRPTQALSPTTTPSPFTIDTTRQEPQPDLMFAVFSGVTRTGRWRIRKTIQAVVVFGGVNLDLRDAIFEGPVVEITGFWCFGGLDIKVPAGVEVRDQTVSVFGGTDVKDLGEPVPGAPVLVLKGLTLFGGVTVKGPRPPRRRR